MTTADLPRATEEFSRARPRLFGIAYRMLGSVAEAEDVVQDTWLRWQQADRSGVREPAAFLATTATRLAINAATSARARRERYVGPWLPEPVSTAGDPELAAEQAEALDLAVLLLLERLPATERAAYVLREAFGYPFRQIADILETSEANARQLAHRARRHLDGERREPVVPAERERLLQAFLAAAHDGDLARLEGLLAADAVSYSDGGGKVTAARVPVAGREKVARFLLGVLAKFGQGVTVAAVEANGHVAVLASRDGEPVAVCTIDASPAGVETILIVMNPDKLSAFRP